jgi:hypothetical protein
MGQRVQRVQTNVSEPQMAQAIIEAWTEMFGQAPSKEQVALVLAQNDLETGHRTHMWNYNVGNITTGGNPSFDYFDDLTTSEQMKPGVWEKKNLKYRAYPTLRDGVRDYLRLISSKDGHYANAWKNIVHPDPVAFSKALKAGGYYTADEAPYTKTLVDLFNKINKSDVYEKAKLTPSLENDNFMRSYIEKMKLQDSTPQNTNAVEPILEQYLQQVAASEKSWKRLYDKLLPTNHFVIQVQASHYVESVEFARILCCVLQTELMAKASTHTDSNQVEIECSMSGPAGDCLHVAEQLANATAQAFQLATKKIGGVQVKTNFLTNKQSSYQQIDPKFAHTQYRKFLLKFV